MVHISGHMDLLDNEHNKIELKEYDHTISYLANGEDVARGVRDPEEQYSLVGLKLGERALNKEWWMVNDIFSAEK